METRRSTSGQVWGWWIKIWIWPIIIRLKKNGRLQIDYGSCISSSSITIDDLKLQCLKIIHYSSENMFQGDLQPYETAGDLKLYSCEDSIEVVDLPMENPDNIEHDLQVTRFLVVSSRDISWLSNIIFLLSGWTRPDVSHKSGWPQYLTSPLFSTSIKFKRLNPIRQKQFTSDLAPPGYHISW